MSRDNQSYYKALTLFMAISLIAIWVSASVAVCYAIKYTGNAWCLLILCLLPTPKLVHRDKNKRSEESNV